MPSNLLDTERSWLGRAATMSRCSLLCAVGRGYSKGIRCPLEHDAMKDRNATGSRLAFSSSAILLHPIGGDRGCQVHFIDLEIEGKRAHGESDPVPGAIARAFELPVVDQ